MQSYKVIPKEKWESLSPYEHFQMQRYGNVLCDRRASIFDDEDSEDEHRLSTSEESYFFNLENEASW